MREHFVMRNYPRNSVEQSRQKIEALPRQTVLFKEQNPDSSGTKRIVFPIVYHRVNLDICNVVNQHYSILQNDADI